MRRIPRPIPALVAMLLVLQGASCRGDDFVEVPGLGLVQTSPWVRKGPDGKGLRKFYCLMLEWGKCEVIGPSDPRWEIIEEYFRQHPDLVSHGLAPGEASSPPPEPPQ